MSTSSLQTAGFTIVSALFAGFIYFLARRALLSFRYALGWLLLFLPGLLSVLFLPLTKPISTALEVTPAALLAVSFMVVLVAICIQLSISISGLQEQVRRLSEEVAQLRHNSEVGGKSAN
jgi:hypothetical protein